MPRVFEQCTDTIVRQVDDIKRMVDEFSHFARMPKAVIAGEDVAETVRQVVFMMRVAHPDIDIEVELPEEPMPARFDRRLISQALTNIVKNATEAIGAVPPAELGRGRIVVSAQRDGEDIVIDVIDNGIGLPQGEPQPPARTLRDHARKGHRARARDRRPHPRRAWRPDRVARRRRKKFPAQRGAWMQLRFAAETVERVRSDQRNPSASDEAEQWPTDILIVDDEADIRELVAGILQDEGYGTRTAADSDEALGRDRRAPAATSFSSTFGCRAAGSMACSCSTRSSRSIPNCRS